MAEDSPCTACGTWHRKESLFFITLQRWRTPPNMVEIDIPGGIVCATCMRKVRRLADPQAFNAAEAEARANMEAEIEADIIMEEYHAEYPEEEEER